MPAPSDKRPRILFVDDEPAYLDLLREAMNQYSGGMWDIALAETTSRALSLLQEKTTHLVVVDIQMPVVDGIQFIKLLQRKYPHLPKAVLTGFGGDDYRQACLANGIDLFLEKPRTPEGLEIVYATLDELAKLQPESGFSGTLRQVGLQDVLQMECLARNSSVLEIKGIGRIYIERGSIIHAQMADATGETAFNRLLSLKGGAFTLNAFEQPPARTISGSWEFLLMEAARMRDESLNEGGEQPPVESQPIGAIPASPSPTDAGTASKGVGTELQATENAEANANGLGALEMRSAAEEPVTTFADTIFIPIAAAEETTSFYQPAPSNPALEAAPPIPPKVEEFLITGTRDEPVHQWQCPEVEARQKLLEFVRQKSRQVCQGLPVGAVERIEFEATEARLVVRYDKEHTFLLRTLREQPGVGVGMLPISN